MSIQLSQVVPILNLVDYKLHLATASNGDHPLNVFARDRTQWEGWTRYRNPKSDTWKRPRVLTLIDYYPIPDTWLFGGIYEILKCYSPPTPYDVQLLPDHDSLIGRLLVLFRRGKKEGRRRDHNLERLWPRFMVHSILETAYSGAHFPGFENINIPFSELEVIYRIRSSEWRAPLQSVAGVYVIHDKSNGKKYVGSAYSQIGTIWDRWNSYVNTGHGVHSDELRTLINQQGIDYARRNFVFSILEIGAKNTDMEFILKRESHWKKVLLSGGQFGYNLN